MFGISLATVRLDNIYTGRSKDAVTPLWKGDSVVTSYDILISGTQSFKKRTVLFNSDILKMCRRCLQFDIQNK